jgi:glycosyltransferase 2 family protein
MQRLRKYLGMFLRLLVAAAILAYVFSKIRSGGGMQSLGESVRIAGRHWPWLLAGQLVMFIPMVLCARRWKMILDSQDMGLPGRRVFSIYFIGEFFNTFMMGATGGDLIKAYYTARETHHQKTEAVTSVFIDRAVGMVALCTVVSILVLSRLDFFLGRRDTAALGVTAVVLSVAALIAFVALFWRNLFERWSWLQPNPRYPRIGRILSILARAYNSFYLCRQRPLLLLQLVGLSVLLQLIAIVPAGLVGHALELKLTPLDYLTLAPLVGLVGAIPITPGGVGLREGASVQLFAALGVAADRATLIAFIPYVMLLIWRLLGGAIFLFYTSGTGRSMRQELDELEQQENQDKPETEAGKR